MLTDCLHTVLYSQWLYEVAKSEVGVVVVKWSPAVSARHRGDAGEISGWVGDPGAFFFWLPWPTG